MQLLRDNLTLWTSDMQVLIWVCHIPCIPYSFVFFLFNRCIDLGLFGFRMMVPMKLKKQHLNPMNSSKQILLPIRIKLLLYMLINEGRRCLLLISLGAEILGIHVCYEFWMSWAVLVCPSIFKCFTNYCLFSWGHWSFIIWNWKFKILFFLVNLISLHLVRILVFVWVMNLW